MLRAARGGSACAEDLHTLQGHQKKLQDLIPDVSDYIETTWGRGYVLREPVSSDIQKNGPDRELKGEKKKKLSSMWIAETVHLF